MAMPRVIRGWKRDLPDQRDRLFGDAMRLKPIEELPPVVDLSQYEKPIEDQKTSGSCVGHGVTRIQEMLWAKDKGLEVAQHFSRRFCYFEARRREGTENEDSGCMIRDAVMAAIKVGTCLEETWPYSDDIAAIIEKPSDAAYNEASTFQVLRAFRLNHQSLKELLNCLAADYGFAFGVTLYDSFMDVGSTGIVPMPRWAEGVQGGHCLCATGYDTYRRVIKVTNSWGSDWGDGGRCLFPFEYMTDRYLAADFWTIRSMEGGV